MYDCRRFVDSKGDDAKVLARWVEDWLIARTRAEDTAHFFRVAAVRVLLRQAGRLVPGLPDARHERHFKAVPTGCEYRLVVEYEPRQGLTGLVDRLLVKGSVERAMRKTVQNLDRVFQRRRAGAWSLFVKRLSIRKHDPNWAAPNTLLQGMSRTSGL